MAIEVWYRHLTGVAYVRLYWASADFEEEKVPSQRLLHPLNCQSSDTTTVVNPQEAFVPFFFVLFCFAFVWFRL